MAQDTEGSGGRLSNRHPTPKFVGSKVSCLSSFWQGRALQPERLSNAARDLIQASWRDSTEGQYSSAWKRWLRYCEVHGVSQYSPPLTEILDYLANLFNRGLEYRTINVHRSALLVTLVPIDGMDVGKHHLVR